MAIITANINWNPVPGSFGYLIEISEGTSGIWIIPSSPANPTLSTTYPIDIQTNTEYYVRVSSMGGACQPSYAIKRIYYAIGDCCPPGYTLSVDESICLQVNTTAATPPVSPEITVAKSDNRYSDCGSYIYNPGYSLDGTGTSTQISTVNAFWRNGAGTCTPGTISDGPMNRCALWATTTLSNQDIGFSICVDIPSPETYYIGFGCDNYGILRIDGQTIIEQDPTALDIQYGIVGAPFHVWHIYPVVMTAGTHVIELIGHNDSPPAALGAEIYLNTLSEIQAATSYGDLNLIFSTKDYVGEDVQLGSDGIGYTCPPGYSLVLCDGPAYCTQTLTTGVIPCSTTTTTSTSSTTTTSTSSTTTTTTTTTAPDDIVYFGAKATGSTPIESEILAGLDITVDASLDVTVDWTSFNASPQYCWFAIPALGTPYNKNRWYVDAGNNGNIGTISDLFGAPATVSVSGNNYYVWITNYQTQFTDPCEVRRV